MHAALPGWTRTARPWLLLPLVVMACQRTPPAPSRTLRVAMQVPVAGFLPTTSNQFELGLITGLVYQGLIAGTPQGGLAPALATRWESPDLRTWRFHLRDGVRFHDGTPFTARHVVDAWRAALRNPPGSDAHPWALDGVSGALAFSRGDRPDIPGLVVVDDTTLEVVLDAPSSDLPAATASWSLRIMGPGSSASVVNGTGPWRLVRGQPGDSTYTFARNDAYWGIAARLDSLEMRVINQGTLGAWLARSELDCLPGAEDFASVLQRSDFAVRPSAPHILALLSLNHRNALLQRPEVRRAISLALDRQVMARAVGAPEPEFRASALPRLLVPGDTAFTPIPHDPAAATAVLRPFAPLRPLRIAWASDTTAPLLVALRGQLAAVGLATVLVRPTVDATHAFLRDTIDLHLWRWLPPYPGPDALLHQLFDSRNLSGLANAYGVHDATLDQAFDAERRMREAPRRDSAIVALGQRIFDAAPAIVLWQGPMLNASSKRVTACPSVLYNADFADVDLAP